LSNKSDFTTATEALTSYSNPHTLFARFASIFVGKPSM
jgi:hypothetical protein